MIKRCDNNSSSPEGKSGGGGFGSVPRERRGRNLLIVFLVCFVFIILCSQISAWWNDSWAYRQPINISVTSENLTNYQVKVEINLTEEYNAGKLNSTCKDIRFTNSTDDLIDFWIEECNTTGSNSIFWVEVPSLINNTTNTIYMYYGNSLASSTSSGNNVFEEFDDFSDAGREYLGLVYDPSLTGDDVNGINHITVINISSSEYLMVYNTINPNDVKASLSSDKTNFSNPQMIINHSDTICTDRVLAGDIDIYDNKVWYAGVCDKGSVYSIALWYANVSSNLTDNNSWVFWGESLNHTDAGFSSSIMDVEIVLLNSPVDGHKFWLSVIDASGSQGEVGYGAPRYIFYSDEFPVNNWTKGNSDNPILSNISRLFSWPSDLHYDSAIGWIMFTSEAESLSSGSDWASAGGEILYAYSDSINSNFTRSGRIYIPHNVDGISSTDDDLRVIDPDFLVENNYLYVYYAAKRNSSLTASQAFGLVRFDINSLNSSTDWTRDSYNFGDLYRSNGSLLGDLTGNEQWWENSKNAPYLAITPSTSNWVATTKLNSFTVSSTTAAGIALFDDRENVYLWERLRNPLYNNFALHKLISDVGTDLIETYESTTFPAYLKIEKIGDTKKFYISLDNTIWNLTSNTTELSTNPSVGIYARSWGGTAFSPSFDHFTIRDYTSPEPTFSTSSEENEPINPTPSFSCSPTSVRTGQTITCSCSATDNVDSSPTVSYTANPSTSSTGTYTTTCTATDDAGNSASSSVSYTVSSSGGGGTPTYSPTPSDLQKSYEKTLRKNWKIKFEYKNKSHQLNLNRIIDDDTVQITISSDPITFNLSLGEIKKVNLDNDSYYDLKVFLKDMTKYSANVVIALISEEIPKDTSEEEKVVKSIPKEKNIFLIIFYFLIGIGILILIFVLYLIIKKKKLVINLSIKLKTIRERRRKKREEKRRK